MGAAAVAAVRRRPPAGARDTCTPSWATPLTAGVLNLINPGQPTTPIPLSGVPTLQFDFVPLFNGTLDIPGESLRDVTLESLVTGVGADVLEIPMGIPTSGATPTPRTVQTMASNVEDTEAVIDLSQAVRTVLYTVELAGGSHETFADIGGVATPPVAFPGTPITTTSDRATGGISGWLALDMGMLNHVDRNLAVTNLMAATSASYIDATTAGEHFLELDNGFAVYLQNGTLVEVSHTPFAGGTFDIQDFAVVGEDDLYFASPTSAGTFQIVRAGGDGIATPVTMDIIGTPRYLNVGDTRLVVAYDDPVNTGQSLVTFDLLGANPVMLETGVAGVDLDFFRFPGLGANRLAYNLTGVGVVDVALDGSGRVDYPGTTLAGVTIDGDLDFDAASLVARLFLSSDGPGGAKQVESVLPGNPASRILLGTLPAAFDGFGVSGLYSQSVMITATDTDPGGPQSDVYFADGAAAGSLQRVTDTPTEFEVGLL